jgi:ParB family transcriptional regulator, chromosome partitioning protein
VIEKGKNEGRRALGKGLEALIPGAGAPGRPPASPREYFQCPVDRIQPDPDQPRRKFDKDALDELVESIRGQGVIQPLIVRRQRDGYVLIAGERRWRAAQLAGLKEVPVVIKEATAKEAFEMALVENLQREDLNPIEEAEAYKRLIDEHGYTQTEVADRIGRDRSTVTNSLRLLGLPAEVRGMVLDGELTEGHARALLQAGAAGAITALAKKVVARGMSVREAERQARAASSVSAKGQRAGGAKAAEPSAQVRNLEERLRRALGAKAVIADRRGKGRVEIHYTSYEELDTILEKILR